MTYMDIYLQKFLKDIVKESIDEYKLTLDTKLKNIEDYIAYLNEKRAHLLKLIDSLTSTLENKYIDILHVCNIRCAEEINDGEIQAIKARLDQFEAYCAKIEADLTQQSKERIITEKECHLVQQICHVA